VRGPFIWLTQPELHAGHEKPFYYYLEILSMYELPLLALGVLGALLAFIRKSPLFSFFGAFFMAVLFAASAVEYKVPWILINFLAPLAFLAGFAVKELAGLFRPRHALAVPAFYSLVFAAAVFTLFVFSAVNFEMPAEGENRLSYVQTTMHAKEVIEKISSIRDGEGNQFKMAIAAKQSTWPLPWVFEGFSITYYGLDSGLGGILSGDYSVILFESSAESRELESGEFEIEPFTLRPGLDLVAFYRKPQRQN